jgi:hypothetical protein
MLRNASYSVNGANSQPQDDPLYSVIGSAHYTELPSRSNPMPYYQEIQTDRVAPATTYDIPAKALPESGPKEDGEST